MQVREGDFVESKEGWIFDVKGLLHPPDGVIAFVRYIPDAQGDRVWRGVTYRKIYDLSARYTFLRRHRPQYLRYNRVFDAWLNEVPVPEVAHHYVPQHKTRHLLAAPHLDAVEQQTLDFILLLHEATGIPLEHVGVSGSVLVGLHAAQSDIDLVVYGRANSLAIRATLTQLLHEAASVRPFRRAELRHRYEARQRDTPISFPDYVFHEARKPFQGFFNGREFFLRYVKAWPEVTERYGDVIYRNAGSTTIHGRVVDASDSLFTPCTYTLADVAVLAGATTPVTEVASFRGRFCDQAVRDEWIEAHGKLEGVTTQGRTHYRVVVGSSPRDYMVTLHERRGTEEQKTP
jgi:predicted nucleotidyltransferase